MKGVAAAIAIALLVACDPAIEQPPVSPVVQNITYDNSNTTNVYPPPPPSIIAPPARSPMVTVVPAPSPPAPPKPEEPPLPDARATASLRPNLPSTGVAACDAYLARLEICTSRMISPQTPAYATMLDSFDLSRRNWRRAAQTGVGRDSLVDSCETALRMYNRSVGNQCP